MPDSRKNWLSFLFPLCFTPSPGNLKNIYTVGSQLRWLPPLFSIYISFHLLPLSCSSFYTHYTHTYPYLLLPRPPKMNHHVFWKKSIQEKIQTKCSLSPTGALVNPATINYTIYECVTQCQLLTNAARVRSWEIPRISHLALFVFIWERDGQQVGPLPYI